MVRAKKTTRRPRRKAAGRRRQYRRKYNSNNVIGGPNTCKVIETLTDVNIVANQPYQFDLDGIQGQRAQDIAPSFALYRVAKVIFKYKPNFDTFSSALIGGNATYGVPTLYWKMNRFADAPAAFTADDLRAMGAKPIRLDDKQLTVAYKPNILLANSDNTGSLSGQVKMTPWLNTDAAPETANFVLSTTKHYGHFTIVDSNLLNGTGTTPVCTMEVTVVYEFKNPRAQFHAASESIQTVRPSLGTKDLGPLAHSVTVT